MLKPLGPLAPFHCTVHSAGIKEAGTFKGDDGRVVSWDTHYRVELTPYPQPTLLTLKCAPAESGPYAHLRTGDVVVVKNGRVAGKNGRFSVDLSAATLEVVQSAGVEAPEGHQQAPPAVRRQAA